jgi:hypothetical protein
VNSASYCEALLKLRDAIRRKRPGQLARGVLLHHENARPQSAQATQERIQELQWELPEHPSYSPNSAPSDFHLFHPLKITPLWQKFRWWRKGWNEVAEFAETTIEILQCCRFRRTGKAMRQVCECWWRIYREINVLPGSNIIYFTFYIYLCPI